MVEIGQGEKGDEQRDGLDGACGAQHLGERGPSDGAGAGGEHISAIPASAER